MTDESEKTESPLKKMGITKQEYQQVKKEYSEDVEDPKEAKKVKRLFGFKKKQVMNLSLKKPDQIIVFLLNLKKQIEGPILTKIYGGNFLVIRDHVYRYNPDRVFSFGKYKAIIAREFDRELVGIDDYEEIMYKDFVSKNPGGRVNIDDPVLIKALISARLGERQKQAVSNKWIIIAVIAIIGIIAFFMMSGGGNTPTPPTTP